MGVGRRWGVPKTVQLRARATVGEEILRVAGVEVVTMDCGVRDLSEDVQTVSTIGTCKAIPALHQMH